MRSVFINSFINLPTPIGILGGTFDPIQNAHIQIAELAMKNKKLGSVVFLPAKKNPLKKNAPHVTDANRIAMLELSIASHQNFFISKIEMERQGDVSYSIDTLREIRSQIGNEHALYFIAGSDVIPELHAWKDVHEFFKLLTGFILVEREGFPKSLLQKLTSRFSPQEISMLEEGFISDVSIPISSTHIRELILEGRDINEFVSPQVSQYIAQNNLYSQ